MNILSGTLQGLWKGPLKPVLISFIVNLPLIHIKPSGSESKKKHALPGEHFKEKDQ